MIIKAKTEYTKELLIKYARFNSYKKTSQIVIYCFCELFMLALVGFLIYMAMSTGTAEVFTVTIICTATFPFIVPLILLLLPLFLAKMSKDAIGAVNIYEFSDIEVIIESTLPTAYGQTKAKYTFFESIYETKNIFYLYISKQQAFILKKSDITVSSVSDLQNLFKKNLPANKYIIKIVK